MLTQNLLYSRVTDRDLFQLELVTQLDTTLKQGKFDDFVLNLLGGRLKMRQVDHYGPKQVVQYDRNNQGLEVGSNLFIY